MAVMGQIRGGTVGGVIESHDYQVSSSNGTTLNIDVSSDVSNYSSKTVDDFIVHIKKLGVGQNTVRQRITSFTYTYNSSTGVLTITADAVLFAGSSYPTDVKVYVL